jgi:hypothetical protein
MRKLIIGAAALLAVALPGVAAADATGYVGLSYATLDDDDLSNKDGGIGLEGAVVANAGGSWNVQFDAHHAGMEHGDHEHAFSNATAHLFTRNADWAAGGFAGLANRDGSSRYHVGVEGQLYLTNATISAAYMYADETEGDSYEASTLDVEGSFFVTPNTAIGAGVGWFDDEWEGEDGFHYNVNVEHQFAGTPYSIGAAYFMYDADYESGGGHETDGFLIFGRWNFGTADLQTRSREGASMIGGVNHVRYASALW